MSAGPYFLHFHFFTISGDVYSIIVHLFFTSFSYHFMSILQDYIVSLSVLLRDRHGRRRSCAPPCRPCRSCARRSCAPRRRRGGEIVEGGGKRRKGRSGGQREGPGRKREGRQGERHENDFVGPIVLPSVLCPGPAPVSVLCPSVLCPRG